MLILCSERRIQCHPLTDKDNLRTIWTKVRSQCVRYSDVSLYNIKNLSKARAAIINCQDLHLPSKGVGTETPRGGGGALGCTSKILTTLNNLAESANNVDL